MSEEDGFSIDSQVEIVASDGTHAAKHLQRLLAKCVGSKPPLKDYSDSKVKRIVFTKNSDRLRPESYALAVTTEYVTIEHADDSGAFYAVQTIRQLLPPDIEASNYRPSTTLIPCIEITDWPRFKWRGMHLDVSRHFFPPDFIKRYIDFISMHKMNVFHWHLVDDGGWRLETQSHPKLTEIGAWRTDTGGKWPGGDWNYSNLRFPGQNRGHKLYGGYYTKQEIREIIAYALERSVTIVPEIEMPGHALPALVAYPELGCDNIEPPAEPGFSTTNVFCAGKESTYQFLEQILSEVIELFPSPWIHIGADEVWKDFWKNCPKCQDRMRSEKLNDVDELQSYFVKRIAHFLASKGRTLIGWDEILEGGLAPKAIVMSWRGTSGGIAAAKAGHDVIMCPTSHCYFDYTYDTTPTKLVYSFEPVPQELSKEEANHVLGGQANVWTEFIPSEKQAERMIFPRMLAMAETLWTEATAKDWDDFAARLEHYYARLDAMNVEHATPGPSPKRPDNL